MADEEMLSELFGRMTGKDTKDGYNALLAPEALSDASSALYPSPNSER